MSNKVLVWTEASGCVAVLTPTPGVPKPLWMKDIPEGVTDAEQINITDLPQNKLFRMAWKKEGKKVVVEFSKAQQVAHEIRRVKRDLEFSPFDDVVAKQLPNKKDEAELCRVKIRAKYDKVQKDIDAALTVEELEAILMDV